MATDVVAVVAVVLTVPFNVVSGHTHEVVPARAQIKQHAEHSASTHGM